ncbi:MAG: sugar-binding protein [Clostridia bacterium]|nr:sugar-binding protein [Clostridia bacterium]
MKKLLALVLVLSFIMSMGLATALADDSIQVGIVLPTKDEPRWIQDETRFSTILDQAGFTYQVLFSQGNVATEKSNVETLVSKGMKVLIICPHDATAVQSTVEYAHQEGVTVISYDRLINDTTAIDYVVGFDSESVGVAQGQYLIDQAEGTGNPLYLYAGAMTDENAFIFFNGAWKVLQPKIADGTFRIINSKAAIAVQDKPELTREELAAILGEITNNWDFNVQKSKAEADLTVAPASDKGTVYILAPNDGTARAAADVFATDRDVEKYFITGQDAEVASIQYIIEGKQSMTVLKDTRYLTDAAVAMAKEILDGAEVTTNAIYNNNAAEIPMNQLQVISVTQDSVKADIIESGYYEASQFTGLE